MDNQRIFIWGAVALVWFFLYQAWLVDNTVAPTRPAASQVTQPGPAELPVAASIDSAELPSVAAPSGADPVAPEQVASGDNYVRVVTDVYELMINTRGADIQQLELNRYPVAKNQPDVHVRLLDTISGHDFVYQTGLRIPGAGDEPTHLATYTSPKSEYRLADGEKTLDVPFTWTDANGLVVTKVFTFSRGLYRIGLNYSVENRSNADVTVAPYLQLRREAWFVSAA